MTTTESTTETIRLVGWGTFAELKDSIRPRLFGEMVKRAIPVVKEYHSDLFHDVHWLEENVTGETTFDFLVRTSGTNLGESARIMQEIGAPGGVMYRVTLRCVGREWMVDFTEVTA